MSAVPRLAAAALCALAVGTVAHAAGVQGVHNVIPSSAARIAQAAPKPTGLMPVFPAGLTDGSGAAVATNPVASSTSTIPPTGSSVATTTLVPAEVPPADTSTDVGTVNVGTVDTTGNATVVTTPVVSAAAVRVVGAGATVPGPGQTPGGAGGVSAVDAARAFYLADANHDGELTRAEFARLPFHTQSFEEMDRNFDGVISRFEWEDSLQ